MCTPSFVPSRSPLQRGSGLDPPWLGACVFIFSACGRRDLLAMVGTHSRGRGVGAGEGGRYWAERTPQAAEGNVLSPWGLEAWRGLRGPV